MAVKLLGLVMMLGKMGPNSLVRNSLVTSSLVTMLANGVSSSLVRSQCIAGREGKRVCTDPTTYCDTFEDSCKSCISLCEDASQFEDCHLHCKDFLQSLITIHNTKERSDIQTLTIMVAVTAAMTSVVLIAVFCLITMKMSKAKRRLKKKVEPTSLFTVDKEKVELDLRSSSNNTANNLGLSNSASTTDNTMSTLGLGGLNRTGESSLRAGPSLQTMSTQLSDESQMNYGVNINPNYNMENNNRRHSFNQSGRGPRTRRVPSEDCVAEDFPGRDGLGRERGQVI
jgi:hypothetical protein